MNLLVGTLAILLSLTQLPPKEGKIETTKDSKTDFSKFTTYTWVQGYPAHDQVAHKVITEGIEAELAARGFNKLEQGQGSVNIRYFTVLRTDVDLDSLDKMKKEGKPPETKNLGRLVIVMRDATDKRVWTADTVQPVSLDPTTRAEQIRSLVARMFETYPGQKK
jgi:Domain of unknown function (DUF4136)